VRYSATSSSYRVLLLHNRFAVPAFWRKLSVMFSDGQFKLLVGRSTSTGLARSLRLVRVGLLGFALLVFSLAVIGLAESAASAFLRGSPQPVE